MKKFSLVFMILMMGLCTLSAYGQNDSESPAPLGSFDSIAIHIPAQTEIIRGPDTSVDIDMPEKVARHIEVYNDRGTLTIRSTGGSWIKNSDTVKIRIAMPYWESLKLSSSGIIRSEDSWNSSTALIRTSGSGDIILNNLKAGSAEFSTSGSGDISLNSLDSKGPVLIHSTGSGTIFIPESSASTLEVKLTGSGDFEGSTRSGALLARLSGSGRMRISGFVENADLQTTGSGEIDGSGLMAEDAFMKITGSGHVNLKDGT
ncbi:DUF2807 domain-containing protein, partial [Oceanispirochaeta sp.]|uniref:GIN domain-containing protein n=1 Tax=Oceanispirochaeta sp. TaxID=2035350 RepID=UPI00262B9086